jgi:hypothetical protein
MVKSVLKKSPSYKSYSKNSEWSSKKFLIKMSIFVLQRYLCYEYWAMCYEVFFMCYVNRPNISIPLNVNSIPSYCLNYIIKISKTHNKSKIISVGCCLLHDSINYSYNPSPSFHHTIANKNVRLIFFPPKN